MKHIKRNISILLVLMMICSSWSVFGLIEAEALDEQTEDESTVTEETIETPAPGSEETAPLDAGSYDADEEETPDDAADTDTDNGVDADSMAGYAEEEFSECLRDDVLDDLKVGTEEDLLEGYVESHAVRRSVRGMEKSSRAWNLEGKNLIFYNNVKQLASDVAAGTQSDTCRTIQGKDLISKNTFTASELGLDTLAVMSDNGLVLTEDAKEIIKVMFAPESWSDVMTAALLDMPYELYWYNRFNTQKCMYVIKWKATYTTKSITISMLPADTYVEIWLPLIEDYGIEDGSNYFIYKADTDKTGAAAAAAKEARAIVSRHASESDYDKLKSYLEEVCNLTDYDNDAASSSEDLEAYQVYNSPWQIINVFDGDPGTKVVCAGYGKAYKFLCDISSFSSNWIECQTIYGEISRVINGNTYDQGAHLWCTVRMNSGLNYIVDPTWYDGDAGYYTFLQGGSSDSNYCDVDTYRKDRPYSQSTFRYAYNSTMRKIFSASELQIADNDYDPQVDIHNDAPISISPARITNIGNVTYTGSTVRPKDMLVQVDGHTLKEGADYTVDGGGTNVGKATCTITGCGQYTGSVAVSFNVIPKGTSLSSLKRGSKRFTVRWKKQTAKMKSRAITGYQIQYSTDSQFRSGNKTVTVKGAKKKSRTVKKLGKKKRYYVRVRTYLTVGSQTFYSNWSSAKSVKTK